MLEEPCKRQKKGKSDNCALCEELDKEEYKNCNIKYR